MTDYKLVTVEPTPEMVEAANDAYMPFGDMEMALRMPLLAAPAVQGEPVGWQYYQDGKWWNGDDRIKDHRKNTEEAGFLVRDVYAAPQPEEQQPDVTQLVGDVKYDTMLFCDLKMDEEKSTFFLSGRGYETGVIAQAIQNDVAMAYHRCSEYRKEMEALQAENALLRAAIRRLCNIYVVDDYYMGQLREESLDAAVNRLTEAALATYRKGGE